MGKIRDNGCPAWGFYEDQPEKTLRLRDVNCPAVEHNLACVSDVRIKSSPWHSGMPPPRRIQCDIAAPCGTLMEVKNRILCLAAIHCRAAKTKLASVQVSS